MSRYDDVILADSPTAYVTLGQPSAPSMDDSGNDLPVAVTAGTVLWGVPDGSIASESGGTCADVTNGTVQFTLPAVTGPIWSFECRVLYQGAASGLRRISRTSQGNPLLQLYTNGGQPIAGGWGGSITQPSIVDGAWHFLALTLDGVTASFYRDGQVLQAPASNTNINALPWWLGMDGATQGSGLMSKAAFWSGVALTPQQIADHVAAAALPALPPTAPQNVTATPGLRSATVSWDPPASDGGAPVTEYVVEWEEVGGA